MSHMDESCLIRMSHGAHTKKSHVELMSHVTHRKNARLTCASTCEQANLTDEQVQVLRRSLDDAATALSAAKNSM